MSIHSVSRSINVICLTLRRTREGKPRRNCKPVMLMDVQLSNTTAIFQLSFGLNAVCAGLINRYLSQTRDLVIDFTNKIKAHKPDFSIEGKDWRLRKFLFGAMIGYRLVRRLFIFCISLALCSVLISFYFLIKAAFCPNASLQGSYFLAISVTTIVINPIIYFIFFTLSDIFLRAVKQKIDVEAALVPLIEEYLSWPETLKNLDAMMQEATKRRREFRYKIAKRKVFRILGIVLHPVRSIKSWRATNLADKILREHNLTDRNIQRNEVEEPYKFHSVKSRPAAGALRGE